MMYSLCHAALAFAALLLLLLGLDPRAPCDSRGTPSALHCTVITFPGRKHAAKQASSIFALHLKSQHFSAQLFGLHFHHMLVHKA
jgi:hypothetical protein